MTKIFLLIILFFATTINAYAAKSAGQVTNFTQPDGTTISVKLLGDENFCWYQTTDDVLLVRVDDTFYIANVTGNGTLESSGVIAHNADARSAEETAKASAQNTELFFSEADASLAKARKAIVKYPSSSFCPHSGTIKVPIIMMQYPDKEFSIASTTEALKTIFEDYFNGTTKTAYSYATRLKGYSSVHQYFADASDDQLNFTFVLYGPYTANNNHDYYGNANGKYKEIIKEAITKADDDIDFTEYDSNNDGKVDMAYILYAGTGANISGNNKDIWPACFYGQSYSADGMTINTIGYSNELASENYDGNGTPLRAGIGVLCHEMSHGLGMPDLYWTLSTTPKDANGNSDYNNCGPEDWDLMDGGENIYNGIWPCQYTAWERDIMGWRDLTDLNQPSDVTIYPSNQNQATSYKVTNPDNEYEYYTFERIPTNEWNSYLQMYHGDGLMITHVNASSSGLSMMPNNTYGKPNVTLVPADGFILASYSLGKTITYKGATVTLPSKTFYSDYFYPEAKGDPYPGSQSVTSVAAYKNYTGKDMVNTYPVCDITSNSDGSISFKFMGGEPLSPCVPGDANNDGKITPSDLPTLVEYLNGIQPGHFNLKSADANNDGIVNTNDTDTIVNTLLSK